MPCHAIVRFVQPKKIGSIVIPEKPVLGPDGQIASHRDDGTGESAARGRCFLVASSGYYVHQGLRVECDIPIGAEVYVRDPDAQRFGDMHDDHFLVHLSRVLSWRDVSAADRQAAIDEAEARDVGPAPVGVTLQ
jgi:hypothetical protein